ncbi:MAG: hydrogenase maturation peptidase HycI [Candidatus Bathyarchaeota archaeon]|nr:MAG: hydrogenase maturation peptidase HycI [Candidatus Bathyarchaeota archaeon]
MKELKNLNRELRIWLEDTERVVVIGIGNELRKDDFVGMKVAQGLKGKVSKRVMIIESGTLPESFIEPIELFNPTHILIIDAGILKLKPGNLKFIESSKALNKSAVAISTHALPLKIFCSYLEKTLSAKIAFIIIQPEKTEFGEGLSLKVEKTAQKLQQILIEILQTPT